MTTEEAKRLLKSVNKMTNAEIRKKLGLMTANEARLNGLLRLGETVKTMGREYAAENWNRGTGRTTNIIIAALEEMQNGKFVRFVGHTKQFEDMMARKCAEYAEKLGLDVGLIVNLNRKDSDETIVFNDHYKPRLY